jgi:hypothetical protein
VLTPGVFIALLQANDRMRSEPAIPTTTMDNVFLHAKYSRRYSACLFANLQVGRHSRPFTSQFNNQSHIIMSIKVIF